MDNTIVAIRQGSGSPYSTLSLALTWVLVWHQWDVEVVTGRGSGTGGIPPVRPSVSSDSPGCWSGMESLHVSGLFAPEALL